MVGIGSRDVQQDVRHLGEDSAEALGDLVGGDDRGEVAEEGARLGGALLLSTLYHHDYRLIDRKKETMATV